MRHDHLRRLELIWQRAPVYFITACVTRRRAILANADVHPVLHREWCELLPRYGWAVGRYVIMPDHVHFFAAPTPDTPRSLAFTIGKWKEWTAKRLIAAGVCVAPVWQAEFFDHLLRSAESRSEKWSYIANNPVRARLVRTPDEWPFAGRIDFD